MSDEHNLSQRHLEASLSPPASGGDYRAKLRAALPVSKADMVDRLLDANTDITPEVTMYNLRRPFLGGESLTLAHVQRCAQREPGPDLMLIEDPDNSWLEAMIDLFGLSPTLVLEYLTGRDVDDPTSISSARVEYSAGKATFSGWSAQYGRYKFGPALQIVDYADDGAPLVREEKVKTAPICGCLLEAGFYLILAATIPGSFDVPREKKRPKRRELKIIPRRCADRIGSLFQEFSIPHPLAAEPSEKISMQDYIRGFVDLLHDMELPDKTVASQILRDMLAAQPDFWNCLDFAALQDNVKVVRHRAEHMAYAEIANPSGLERNVLSRWHGERQDLATIKSDLRWLRRRWLNAKHLVDDEGANSATDLHDSKELIAREITNTIDDAEKLEGFLFDLGQVLIGTVTLQDSERSTKLAEQSNILAGQANDFVRSANDLAERGMWLTLIAAVYLPLTLVTGIFGMNIKEINDGTPRWWACLTTFALVGTPSLAAAIWIFMKDRNAKAGRVRASNGSEARDEAVP